MSITFRLINNNWWQWWCGLLAAYWPKSITHTFPQYNFPRDGEAANLLQTCWQQVIEMGFGKWHDTVTESWQLPRTKSATSPRHRQQVCNKSVASDRNKSVASEQTQRTCCGLVIYVLDLLRTFYGEVANLLRTCYGETGVMDFGLNAISCIVC